jgi:lipoprotein Spr
MKKPHAFICLIMILLAGCEVFKPVQSPALSSSSSSKQNTPFLEDIVVTTNPDAKTAPQKEEDLPPIEDDYRSAIQFNTGMSVGDATMEQFRYSILLNTEVEYLSNKELYRLIHAWWGTPYKIGGMTQRGVDCSAFVQTVMAGSYELALPRTAKEQKQVAATVERSDLREGDLVFFNTRGGVSHVGIYLHNNKFVHASTSGGVTISDLSEAYWAKRYLGAGRVTQ